MMATDLYIYYRVATDDADTLVARVHAMQAQLFTTTGIQGNLKRRPETRDGCHTWMEVYPDTDKHFPALLDAAVHTHELPALINGQRHTEIFMDVSSCA